MLLKLEVYWTHACHFEDWIALSGDPGHNKFAHFHGMMAILRDNFVHDRQQVLSLCIFVSEAFHVGPQTLPKKVLVTYKGRNHSTYDRALRVADRVKDCHQGVWVGHL